MPVVKRVYMYTTENKGFNSCWLRLVCISDQKQQQRTVGEACWLNLWTPKQIAQNEDGRDNDKQ